jgi:hypothetical protein
MSDILELYRERGGDPGFWAEPFNAVTNISFLIAAYFAYRLAAHRKAVTPLTLTLVILAFTVGIGSFLFHTAAGPVTLWLDVIPIVVFQVLFLWLAYHRILGLSKVWSTAVVAGVLIASFLLMRVDEPLNGSLFYLPAWVAILVLGITVATAQRFREPWLLMLAAICFTVAIAARSMDKDVSWTIGTHFLWHSLNGLVVYLGLRSFIVEVHSSESGLNLESA